VDTSMEVTKQSVAASMHQIAAKRQQYWPHLWARKRSLRRAVPQRLILQPILHQSSILKIARNYWRDIP
jgi:hypothetical protein